MFYAADYRDTELYCWFVTHVSSTRNTDNFYTPHCKLRTLKDDMVDIERKSLDRFWQLENLMKKINGRLSKLKEKCKENLGDEIKVPKELSVSF